MPDLDVLAEQASRATSRWYGSVRRFNVPPEPWVSCADWFKAHWRAHPDSSPLADPDFWDGVEDDDGFDDAGDPDLSDEGFDDAVGQDDER